MRTYLLISVPSKKLGDGYLSRKGREFKVIRRDELMVLIPARFYVLF